MRRILIAAVLLACPGLCTAQGMKNYVLAVRRGGVIEFIDPVTLNSVSQLHCDVGPRTSGLNGVAASADGTTLYVEGPITDSSSAAGSCCFLYSIDLATLHAERVAGVWGSHSRQAFVVPSGIVRSSERVVSRSRHQGHGQ